MKKSLRRKRWIVWGSVAGALVIVLGLGAWVGVKAVTAKNELETAKSLLSTLMDEAKSFDLKALETTASELSAHTAAASSAVNDPLWRAAEVIPWVGQNLYAVRAISTSLDEIVTDVAVPAVHTMAGIDPSKRSATGGFDLAPLSEAAKIMASAPAVLDRAHESIGKIDRSMVIDQIGSVLTELDGQLNDIDILLSDGATMLTFASDFLGVEGDRTIVLMFQNNAEVTALGGSAASYTVIKANDGNLVRQGTDLGRPVAIWEVPLANSETRDFTVTFTGAPGTYGPLQMRGTPMINKTAVTIDPAKCR